MNLSTYAQFAAVTAIIVLVIILITLFLKTRWDRSTARQTLLYAAAINKKTFSEVFETSESDFDKHVESVLGMHHLN